MLTASILLLFRDNDGKNELMFVRQRGKPHFVHPGGTLDYGETPEEALVREIREELECAVESTQQLATLYGRTPEGKRVRLHVFSGELVGDPQPCAEIEEISWMDRGLAIRKREAMTPMTLTRLIPFLMREGMW